MSDALCGPSNALQNLQKHSAVDRTLQQDRLVGRHSPSQGFRSSNGNAGALDSEFEAFQAGLAGPAQLQADVHHLPPHLAHAPQPPPHFAHAPAGPDWASDFQRLNISNNHAPGVQQHPAPAGPASWHQDFMKLQTPAVPPQQQQQYGIGNISVYGMARHGGSAFQQPMGFGGVNGGLASQVTLGNQNTQTSAQRLDAVFEKAFAQLDQDLADAPTTMAQSQNTHQRTDSRDFRSDQYAALNEVTASSQEVIKEVSSLDSKERLLEEAYRHTFEKELEQEVQANPHSDTDASTASGRFRQYVQGQKLLRQFETQRPALFATYSLRNAVALDVPNAALIFLEALEKMEEKGILLAGKLETHTITREIRDLLSGDCPQEVRTRAERLMQAINERRMSSYPLFSSDSTSLSADALLEELQQVDTMETFMRDVLAQQAQGQTPHGQTSAGIEGFENHNLVAPERQRQDQDGAQSPLHQQHDDDEMAHTAGQLLERVADNTSEKFQNSQFLQLMRKLRDREVKVEGDKMVEVSSAPSLQSQQAQLPPSSSSAAQPPPAPSATAIPGIDPTILSHADSDFALPVFSEDTESIPPL